jgi:hypothetical protein
MIKKRYIVAISIAITLSGEFLMSKTWLGREALLSIIAPDPDPRTDCLLLTNDAVMTNGKIKVGTLRAGQIIYQPCRHDLFLTEPNDPRVWKVYVEFGEDNGQSIIAYKADVKPQREVRGIVRLEDEQRRDN